MKDRLNSLIKWGSLAIAGALTLGGAGLLYMGYTDNLNSTPNLIAGAALLGMAMIALKAGEIIRE